MFVRTWYINHSGCLKGWHFLPFYFLSIIFCIYTCLSLGHCYKQIWYFTPLFSSVVVSLGFGLVIRMFFWWREDRPFYALLSSGFVWMLLSLCTLISIVSGLRTSLPFSSFSGSFLQRQRNAQRGSEIRSLCTSKLGHYKNLKHTYHYCEQAHNKLYIKQSWITAVREFRLNGFLQKMCA